MPTGDDCYDFEGRMSELGTLAYKLSGGDVPVALTLLAAVAASLTVMPPEEAADGRADTFVRAYRDAIPLVRRPRVMRPSAAGRA
jgi:hypothetical protein